MKTPILKFQYPVNKRAENILHWLEKEMYKIPSVIYNGARTHYYTELNYNAIEVHYKSYNIQTNEYLGGDIQFSFEVNQFDSSTSIIGGKFYNTRDTDLEKLAYTYLFNLGKMVDATWKTEVLQHLELLQSPEPEKPEVQEPWKLSRPGKQERDEIIWNMRERNETWDAIKDALNKKDHSDVMSTIKLNYKKMKECT